MFLEQEKLEVGVIGSGSARICPLSFTCRGYGRGYASTHPAEQHRLCKSIPLKTMIKSIKPDYKILQEASQKWVLGIDDFLLLPPLFSFFFPRCLLQDLKSICYFVSIGL